jgi:phosphoenolpyruvate carboxykinase (ATP)
MNRLIFNKTKIHHQLSVNELISATLEKGQGALNDTGALCISTGNFTGRSPRDKFTVYEPETAGSLNWNETFNHKLAPEYYSRIKEDILVYMGTLDEIWSRKCYACASPQYKLGITVYNEYPSGNLFAANMFLPLASASEHGTIGEWTILQAPGFMADPVRHGTRSVNFSVISFTDQTILIGGTGYTGEMKKGIFTVLNYLLPNNFDILSMHCSANIGKSGDTALFFGLSGTGKTTLSTDPERKLIGDDEHGWDDDSVFNFEGGCYAKTIGLNEKYEPEIFAAIRSGALVENVVFQQGTNVIDFHDSTLTENTRVSYPLNFIKNIAKPSVGSAPKTIFFLTCDASGVLPPISRLTVAQAKYYFLSGYTSKVAGTEAGITEPKPTFSACFGAPFLPLHPSVYADLLGQKLMENEIKVWLVNTGWSGLPHGEGERISIKHTRAMVTAALNGQLDEQEFENFPVFNLQVPKKCPGVPDGLLNPIGNLKFLTPYLNRLNDLAVKFAVNFSPFENLVTNDIFNSAPRPVQG